MESGEGEDETQQQEMKAASDDRMRAEVNSNIKTEMATWKRSKSTNGDQAERTEAPVIGKQAGENV